MPDPLATPEDLATFLRRDVDTANATFLIAMVSAAVRAYCGWHIAGEVTEEITVNGSGAQLLALPTLHLTDVTTVTENADPVDLAGVSWSTAGYLWREGCWTRALRGVIATITHGYEDVPLEIVAVICGVTSRAYVSPDGVVRAQTGPFSVTYSQTAFNQAGGIAFTEAERWALDRYRIPGRP